jgi:hypothetical protein
VTSEVAPRAGLPAYRVLAGEVTVEVVGTKFTVERGEGVSVGVEHGRVRVTRGAESVVLEAGQRWPEPAEAIEPPEPEPRIEETPDAKALFKRAQALEASRREAAARLYRQAADQDGSYAQEALHALAELELERKRPAAALRAADEYVKRFPRGVHIEDARWYRVVALQAGGRKAEARTAAREYLTKHPRGTFVEDARVIADSP